MINRIIDICAKNRFLVFLFIGVAVLLGWHSMNNTKLDAIPDLSDTQVIVYSKWDRSPDIMEDQVTYPVTSALLGMPKVRDIRASTICDPLTRRGSVPAALPTSGSHSCCGRETRRFSRSIRR